MFRKSSIRTKKNEAGYVAILMCALIPLLLLGVKYVLDLNSQHRVQLYSSDGEGVHKRCAREAALKVARCWNPALTLTQQKESVLRVADDVYNNNPCHYEGAPVHGAIPGLELKRAVVSGGKEYDPLKVTLVGTGEIASNDFDKDLSPSFRTVAYNTVNTKEVRSICLNGGNQAFYRIMYGSEKDPRFLLQQEKGSNPVSEDLLRDFLPGLVEGVNVAVVTLRNEYRGVGPYAVCFDEMELEREATYTTRVNSADNKVQIAIENDQIRVQTDRDVGYAVPAECNADIVLAIPVNRAACSSGDDPNTEEDEGKISGAGDIIALSGWTGNRSYAERVKLTPIYQIAQGFKTFLRKNFEFTRGINVGLIPYSGKICIPPHRKVAWTENIEEFKSNPFVRNIGATLYAAQGLAGKDLSDPYINEEYAASEQNDPLPAPRTVAGAIANGLPSFWGVCCGGSNHEKDLHDKPEIGNGVGGASPLTAVMCRGSSIPAPEYGGNLICVGDLLSTDNPATSSKWRRMNNNPCLVGYANPLNMKCERERLKANSLLPVIHLAPPYFLIELQADVGKICDLLNVTGPFCHRNNVSNFVFLAPIWANNLFRNWTEDPACEAENTVGSSPSKGGQLSRPSKSTPGRKKVLILVVNKPDHFEPGELTYLGFDNDFSEVPMYESAVIDFRINFSDTTKTFADGTAYNGTFADPKRILKYTTGFSSSPAIWAGESGLKFSGNAVGALRFRQKGLIRLRVAPIGGDLNEWYNPAGNDQNALEHIDQSYAWYGLAYSDDKWMATNAEGYVAVSEDDGLTWINPAGNGQNPINSVCGNDNSVVDIAGGDGKWIALSGSGYVACSTDGGASWTNPAGNGQTPLSLITPYSWYSVAGGGGKWMALNYYGYIAVSADGGASWTSPVGNGQNPLSFIDSYGWYSSAVGNGKWMALNYYGYAAVSSDGGASWSNPAGNGPNPLMSVTSYPYWTAIAAGGGKWLALENYGYIAVSADDGKTWINPAGNSQTPPILINNVYDWNALAYGGGKWMALSSNGFVAVCDDAKSGRITLPGEGTPREIVRETDIFIEPSRIFDTKDENGEYHVEFQMEKIRLISAEITNRPYTFKIPSCSLSGTKNAAGTEGVLYVHVNAKIPVTLMARTVPDPESTELAEPNFAEWYNPAGNGQNPLECVWNNGGSWSGLICSNGKWMALNNYGYVAVSTDGGKTWSNPSVDGPNPLYYVSGNNTYIGSSYWEGLACGNGKWMALNSYGYVAVSADGGVSWSNPAGDGPNPLYYVSGNSSGWWNLVYGDGKWMALNSYGYTVVSTDDGASWICNNSNALLSICSQWEGLAYGNNKWMAVGTGYGYVACSTDNGASWTNPAENGGVSSLGSITMWRDVEYNNGKWVVLGYSGYVAHSVDDGKNWTFAAGGQNPFYFVCGGASGWKRLACGGGQWMALSGNGYIAVCGSPSLPPSGTIEYTDKDDAVISVAVTDLNYGPVVLSPKTHKYKPDGGGGYVVELKLKNVRICENLRVNLTPACSVSGDTSCLDRTGTAVITSNVRASVKMLVQTAARPAPEPPPTESPAETDFSQWYNPAGNGQNALEHIYQSYAWYGLAYSDDKWMATDGNGYVAVSTDDGMTWINPVGNGQNPLNSVCGIGGAVADIAGGDGKWMALDYSGYVAVSTDGGASWTNPVGNDQNPPASACGNSGSWIGLTCGNGKWMALNDYGYVAVSTDGGASWTSPAGNGSNALDSVFYYGWKSLAAGGGGKWMALSDLGYVAVSADGGASWTNPVGEGQLMCGSVNHFWTLLAYGGGKWLAMSNTGNITVSADDGKNWTNPIGDEQIFSGYDWNGLAAGGGKWMALNNYGYISVCGTPPPPPPPSPVGTIKYKNGNGLSAEVTVTSSESEEIIISPGTHWYNELSETSYTVELQLDNVRIISIEPVDTTPITDPPLLDDINPVFEYLPISLPQRSRVVDFSQNVGGSPQCSDSVTFGEFPGSIGRAGVTYDTDLGYWKAKSSDDYFGSGNNDYSGSGNNDYSGSGNNDYYGSGNNDYSGSGNNDYSGSGISSWNKFYYAGTKGDFYLLLEHEDGAIPQMRFFDNSGKDWHNGKQCDAYGFTGLHRKFQISPDIYDPDSAGFDIMNPSFSTVKYIIGGFTSPINVVLYYGAAGSNLHQHSWQSNGSGVVECDPSEACRRVTAEACSKLKADYGDDIRIYVIKYYPDSSDEEKGNSR
ncbi:MAG: glycoside hydrolase [Holosporaceae bacterium]|jgi:hypothetical protein|nr:glycoside hydrolase [Holosporaceae bacterium]